MLVLRGQELLAEQAMDVTRNLQQRYKTLTTSKVQTGTLKSRSLAAVLINGNTNSGSTRLLDFSHRRSRLASQVVASIVKFRRRVSATALSLLLLLGGMAFPLRAGTLSGNVKAGHGESVVYLAPLRPLKLSHSGQIYTIHQKSMRFAPSVLAVPQGATVEFPNDDAAPHNVYWKSIGGNTRLAHDLGIVARGHKAVWTFTHPGDVFILCSFHREMSAHIIVAPSPYFAKTDAILGDYFISGVPDGKYRVSVWHNGNVTSKLITVAGDTRANFALTH